ncbi:MAG: MFS transporter, partial [Clostridia bacterium]|nr:MFS transporter [Clostridia bacterium]
MKHEKNLANGVETTDAKKLKLDYGQTFKVGLAFAGIILFWNAYDFVIPLLLENTYGLPNALRGFIMGLDNLLSLFMLPLFGKLSDNSKGKLTKKFGRRTPFIVIGTICAIILMVFVPVATLGQQAIADDYTASIEAKLNDDQWMESLLSQWYDNAVAGKGEYYEVDIEYLNNNGIDREHFVSIRFDEKLTSKKALLLFGEETFYYDGVEISDLNAVAPNGRTYQEIIDSNKDYKTFVASSINGYIGEGIYEEHTTTKSGISSLAVYMVILLLVLVAMASFRSPAVALMPDVTPKPLRSKGNAVVNLLGTVAGAIVLVLGIVFGTGKTENALMSYTVFFSVIAALMMIALVVFKLTVKEVEWAKEASAINDKLDEKREDHFTDTSPEQSRRLSRGELCS